MTSRKSAAIETKSGDSTLLQDLKVGWGVCRGGEGGGEGGTKDMRAFRGFTN